MPYNSKIFVLRTATWSYNCLLKIFISYLKLAHQFVLANGSRNWGSISGWVIPKTQKMVLTASLLNPQPWSVPYNAKWSNPGKGVVPSPTPWCSSYLKGSLWVILLIYFKSYNCMQINDYGPPHMAKQKQDQREHTYSSYVRIRDVALKTCQRWWTIGKSGERGSGISVLAAQHDDHIIIR